MILDRAVPGGLGLLELDWIGLAPHPEQFTADPPPTVGWLDRNQVALLIPDLATPMPAARIERQARVNPQRVTARIARQLSHIATSTAATAVRVTGNRISAVVTRAGTFHPAVVIFATGSPPHLEGLALAIPADLIKGHLLVTDTTDIHLPGIVASVAVPLADGRLLVGGTVDIDDDSPIVSEETISSLANSGVARHQYDRRHQRALLAAASSRRPTRHRPGPGRPKRLDDIRALPNRGAHGPRHCRPARRMDHWWPAAPDRHTLRPHPLDRRSYLEAAKDEHVADLPVIGLPQRRRWPARPAW